MAANVDPPAGLIFLISSLLQMADETQIIIGSSRLMGRRFIEEIELWAWVE